MRALKRLLFLLLVLLQSDIFSQTRSLVNTSQSPFAKLRGVEMNDVRWTSGFWADRFQTTVDSVVPNMWMIYNDAKISHAFRNFQIAAGLDTGSHSGPSFHDGDFYKTLESLASVYVVIKAKKLARE